MTNPEFELPSLNDPVDKKKKQKLVKHKRKNWSKTDISDVEKGIDELRQQERTGGVRSEKKDEELFFINKTKLETIEEDASIRKSKRPRVNIKEKLEQLNCYKNLKPDPNSVPAHIVRINKKPEIDSRRQKKLIELEKNKFKSRLASKKFALKKDSLVKLILDSPQELDEIEEAEKQVKLRKKQIKEKSKVEKKLDVFFDAQFEKNLWTSSDLPKINEVNEYYLRSLGKIPVKKPKNPLYTKSAIPNVEVPHPGTSYNPDFDDHQELLLKAHLVELKKLKEEQKLIRRLASNAKKMSWAEIERVWLEEMNVKDIFEPENVEANEVSIENTNEESSIKELRKRSEKIKNGRYNETKAKREKKKLLEKIKKRKQENEKKLRIQQNEIYRLRTLKKEVDEKQKNIEENKIKRELNEKQKELFSAKRLGHVKFEEPELDLKLSDEITGNLRTLKVEGNIMRDRYKSLQKRNIIEPRERAKRYRKFWKKKFDKRNALEKTNYVK